MVLDQQAGPTRLGVVGRVLAEQQLQHLVLAALGLGRVERADVVDQAPVPVTRSRRQLVEPLQRDEGPVGAHADAGDEDRQLAHQVQVRDELVDVVAGLAVRREDRVGRVLGRALDLQRGDPREVVLLDGLGPRPEVTEVDAAEPGLLHDPPQRGDVVRATEAVLAVRLQAALAGCRRDVPEGDHLAVEERERHFTVVVEGEARGERDVRDTLHLLVTAGVELVLAHLGRSTQIEGADHRRLVLLGVEPLLLHEVGDVLVEVHQVRSLFLHLRQVHGHEICLFPTCRFVTTHNLYGTKNRIP